MSGARRAVAGPGPRGRPPATWARPIRWSAEAGLGHEGVLIGRDLLGGSFVYDPFVLYRDGVLTNPNMVVFGQIGRGKSSFVKTYLWRQAVFGRRAWVVDPKGEYGPLAAAWGSTGGAASGGPVRLNPLDTGPRSGGGPDGTAGAGGAVDAAGSSSLASLAVACLGRDLLPRERAAVDVALVEATGRAAEASAPSHPAAGGGRAARARRRVGPALRTDAGALAEDGRDVALELRRLVHGDLRGMFDGPTTPGLRLDGPLVVLDLSAVYHSPALGVLMACATAWLQAAVEGTHRNRIIVVVDEAWAILSNLGVARWLQSSWKLSRALGVSNMAVLHRLSDLRLGRGRRLRAGRAGRGAAGRLGDPGGLRPVPRRGGPAPANCSASSDTEARARHPAAPGRGPVEGGQPVVPGGAPAGLGGAVADRHRPGHGRPATDAGGP